MRNEATPESARTVIHPQNVTDSKCNWLQPGGQGGWEMRRTGAVGGGPMVVWKEKFKKKNQKHEPNIVEITHLCIMHRQRTQRVHASNSLRMLEYLHINRNVNLQKFLILLQFCFVFFLMHKL
jgi:hypothetical protein